MVLFDEDPVSLITETTNQFHISPDKEALSRINSSLSALALNRASRLEAQQATLKILSRKLNTTKSQYEYKHARRDTGRHASEILALDGEKFRVAKSVSEIEVEGERLSSELNSLRRQLEELGREDTAVKDDDRDEAILKLHLFRSLGIELAEGKAIVRSGSSLTVVESDGSKSTTDRVWASVG